MGGRVVLICRCYIFTFYFVVVSFLFFLFRLFVVAVLFFTTSLVLLFFFGLFIFYYFCVLNTNVWNAELSLACMYQPVMSVKLREKTVYFKFYPPRPPTHPEFLVLRQHWVINSHLKMAKIIDCRNYLRIMSFIYITRTQKLFSKILLLQLKCLLLLPFLKWYLKCPVWCRAVSRTLWNLD